MSIQTFKNTDWESFVEYSKRFSRFTHEEVQGLKVKIDRPNFTIKIAESTEYVRILIERYFSNSIWKIEQGEEHVINI
ncbi:hypothetical protein CH376_05990 [Leptospira adleri]|uniref:Uncharacterized protein n=1 Tax=Leptospira adleri TaxID=2023186 RepID=A0ABX4P476_9LEPT|nr:hypothetical protein CH376_05990 [Leptospira adleri]